MDIIKKTLKFNDAEIELIRSLSQSKGHFSEAYVVHGDKRFVACLYPLAEEYWLCTTDMKDKELLEKERREHSDKPLWEIIETLSQEKPFGNRTL